MDRREKPDWRDRKDQNDPKEKRVGRKNALDAGRTAKRDSLVLGNRAKAEAAKNAEAKRVLVILNREIKAAKRELKHQKSLERSDVNRKNTTAIQKAERDLLIATNRAKQASEDPEGFVDLKYDEYGDPIEMDDMDENPSLVNRTEAEQVREFNDFTPTNHARAYSGGVGAVLPDLQADVYMPPPPVNTPPVNTPAASPPVAPKPVNFASIFSGGVDVNLENYTVDQLHALAPYGAMLARMSAAQITQLLDKTSSVTPDGRTLLSSRPQPRRNFLPPQKRFIVTPGGDRMYL